ncbi:MAG: response regulator transcription factor [Kofleriaceae bacterium]|nr:response regulator transcription factor [Kofleriaceae bacterium]
MFRAGLAALLSEEPDLVVTGEAGEAAEAVELLRREPFDVVVLDVLIPSGTAISLAADLLDVRPCRVLALSALDEPIMIAALLRAGASGYALKTQPPRQIIEAIRTVANGGRYLPPFAQEEVLARYQTSTQVPFARLTQREREVFELLLRGLTNDDVSEKLAIARRTVETHRQRIMQKLDTHSMTDMIRLAARYGLLA